MKTSKEDSICAIIPAKNEKVMIAASIGSLLKAGLPSGDIYVVDDGSTDETGAIAAKYGVNVLTNLISLGKVGSIQRAIECFQLNLRYDYISLLDADSQVNPEYFSEIRKSFGADVVLICGYVESLEYNWLTAARALEYMWGQAVYKKGQNKMGTILVSPGCASTYKSSVFEKLELSGDTFVEDMDMTFQIHRKNLGKIAFSETAVSYTQDPRTLPDYCKQMHRWYFGMWQVLLKYRVPFKLQRIDFEATMMVSEVFLISVFYLLFLMKNPAGLIWIFIGDMVLRIGIATYFTAKTGRTDILKYSSLFPFIKLIDLMIFIQTFIEIMILRRKLKTWFTPKRYSME